MLLETVKTVKLEYINDGFDTGFVTGVKKRDQYKYNNRVGGNGTYLDFGEPSELMLTIRFEDGELYDLDVKKQIYEVFNRKRMSDSFEKKLQDSMPELIEVINSERITDNSLEIWRKAFKRIK